MIKGQLALHFPREQLSTGIEGFPGKLFREVGYPSWFENDQKSKSLNDSMLRRIFQAESSVRNFRKEIFEKRSEIKFHTSFFN